MDKNELKRKSIKKPGDVSDFFAQIPADLKTRFDVARGKGKDSAISQSEALTSLMEFALPFVETIAPGKFVFRENGGEIKPKKS